jgi:4a-hydroxytetrahydrobiopterin dehydratase
MSALLNRSQVERQIQDSLPLWTLEENSQTLFLSRKFVAKNFASALDSINQMGAIAEREGHHPDLHLTSYRGVEVNVWTHKLNGITQNDIQLAEMLDKEVIVVYSPQWLKQHPEAAKEV